jgi:hypothetical protein
MTTKTRILKIGTSRGIGVPKPLFNRADLPDEVEPAERGRLVLSAAQRPRAGWAEKARSMHERGKGARVDAGIPTRFDDTEWHW